MTVGNGGITVPSLDIQCPFCGASNAEPYALKSMRALDLSVIRRDVVGSGVVFAVHCYRCQADGPLALTEAAALVAWCGRVGMVG